MSGFSISNPSHGPHRQATGFRISPQQHHKHHVSKHQNGPRGTARYNGVSVSGRTGAQFEIPAKVGRQVRDIPEDFNMLAPNVQRQILRMVHPNAYKYYNHLMQKRHTHR